MKSPTELGLNSAPTAIAV